MNLLHKCVLALILLFAGVGITWATGILKPGADEPVPVFLTSAVVTSDTAIKAVPGYVRFLVCIGTDNSATAGTIALLDHTAAGGGTTVVTWTIQTTYNYATPVVFPVERAFTTAIYLDFTTTADIGCYVVYR